MIKFENHLGSIEISSDYFSSLVGAVAAKSFGVSGMAVSSPAQGLQSVILRRNAPDKGVKVRTEDGKLIIDLHIMVAYGINIAAIVKSIVNEVKYAVEQSTGLDVQKINVFVDGMTTGS